MPPHPDLPGPRREPEREPQREQERARRPRPRPAVDALQYAAARDAPPATTERPSIRPRASDVLARAREWLSGARLRTTLAFALCCGSGLLVVAGGPEDGHVPAVFDGQVFNGEIVVELARGARPESVAALAQGLGIALRPRSVHSAATGIHVATVLPGRRDAVLQALRASPLVAGAGPNWIYRPLWVPNDPNYKEQWHLHSIGMEAAWDVTRGKGAIVAVLDTGVASANTTQGIQIRDLAATTFVPGYDFVDDDDIAQELGGHGSHVSGTIAQSTNNGVLGAGVAPEASIMPIRVLSPLGGDSAAIAEGVRFAADHGAHVINMSLGGGPYCKVFHNAVQHALAQGTTVVCAAGNSGAEGVAYPARFPESIAVSAVGPTGELAPYSTWGKELTLAGPGGDTSRPGGGVYQNTFEKGKDVWVAYNGTSMAAPHVAGVAALLVALGVREPAEVRRVLCESAKSKGSPERYGAGLLDAEAAVGRAAGANRARRGRISLLAATGALFIAIGATREHARRATRRRFELALAFATGMLAPDALEWVLGFGSLLNLAGHSVLPAALAGVLLAQRGRQDLARWLAIGLALHLALDVWTGDSPFLAASWRRSAWLWVNVGLTLFPLIERWHQRAHGPRATWSTSPGVATA